MNLKEVKALIDQLSKAEHAYYVLNNPIMSDGEYDKLFNELKEIELENPDLVSSFSPTQRVTGTPENVFEQVSHKQRMYSLDNSENVVDIEKWIEKIQNYALKQSLGKTSVKFRSFWGKVDFPIQPV